MFSQACVKNSVHWGWGCLPHCMLGYIPWTSLDTHTPPDPHALGTQPPWTHSPVDTPPPPRSTPAALYTHPQDTPPYPGHKPPAQTPPGHTPPGQTTPHLMATATDGTHPTGMHSCLDTNSNPTYPDQWVLILEQILLFVLIRRWLSPSKKKIRISLCIRIRFWMVSEGLPRPTTLT